MPDELLKQLPSSSGMDPETAGAAAASQAMQPAIEQLFAPSPESLATLHGSEAPITSPAEAAAVAQDPTRIAGILENIGPAPLTFGGLGAATANRWAQAGARLMNRAGTTPENIYRRTGWYLDPVDKQWKFEISDLGAKLHPPESYADVSPSQLQIKHILEHPDLFAAYPGAAELPVEAISTPSLFGALERDVNTGRGKTLLLNSDMTEEQRLPTILHELQHYIQGEEGFSIGGRPEEFLPEDFNLRRILAFDAADELKNSLATFGIDSSQVAHAIDLVETGKEVPESYRKQLDLLELLPDQYNALRDLHREAKELDEIQDEAFNNYKRLGGESEAFNVENRLRLARALKEQGIGADMTRAFYPPKTAEFPPEEQILRLWEP